MWGGGAAIMPPVEGKSDDLLEGLREGIVETESDEEEGEATEEK